MNDIINLISEIRKLSQKWISEEISVTGDVCRLLGRVFKPDERELIRREIFRFAPMRGCLLNGISEVMNMIEMEDKTEGIEDKIEKRIEKIRKNHSDLLLKAMSSIEINPAFSIMTAGYSSLIRDFILHVRSHGACGQVICPVNYPLKDGIQFSNELASAGIAVKLCYDISFPSFLDAESIVLCEALAWTEKEVILRKGFQLLLLIARDKNIRFIVLASEINRISGERIKYFQDKNNNFIEHEQELHPLIKFCGGFTEILPVESVDCIITL
jgi:translation initiation factor 2B subunit (eIF-2B alpha/beta/delta family)